MPVNVPANKNFLSPVGYKLEIPRAPNFNYFIQSVDFPTISLQKVEAPTPFRPLNLPADHIQYDDIDIVFKLDEDLKGYFELYEWMKALGRPESGEQAKALYKKNPGDGEGIYSQVSLIVLSSNMQPNIEFVFKDVLPVRLSGFTLESNVNDIEYITARLTLSFRDFSYDYLT
jgi:hypothetical protein